MAAGVTSPAAGATRFLVAFGMAALGVGAARAITTSYVPVLLDRIQDNPALIGTVMLVNAGAGFAVPLAVGVWTDRHGGGRMGPRLPFLLAGAVLTSVGLTAVALGTESSYLFLALAAAVVYVGLNAAATAHRSIVAESFEDGRRPGATSAQETAMLVGALAGVVVGGFLIDATPWLLFAVTALLLPALAIVTVRATLGRLGPGPGRRQTHPAPNRTGTRDLLGALQLRGAREVLVAQIIWVGAYAALPAFFILYADDVLELGAGPASLMLAGFGLFTGAAMVVAGRTPPERVYPLLCLGALLLGGGLAVSALGGSVAAVSIPFAVAAVGAGLVTALGFPYFARFIPDGESGRYTGLFFSVRAIATAVALPLAGLAIGLSGSYRSLLLLGGAALLALIPLGMAERSRAAEPGRRRSPPARLAAVIPCHESACLERVVTLTLAHVDRAVVVADGCSPSLDDELQRISRLPRARVVCLERNAGKGTAVAAGIEAALASDARPDAVVVVDADGQHPPERIPQLAAAAADADLVIGDRLGHVAAMPRVRRFTNRVSSTLLSVVTRRRVRDSQCGMRLYRTELLERVPPPPGRYEAETLHLRAMLHAGARVAWAPIPAIYDDAQSSFRPLRDTVRVLAAIILPAPLARRRGDRVRDVAWPERDFWRIWGVRLAAIVIGTWALAAFIPLIEAADHKLFVAINSLGAGPDWVYQALDPHSRNYVLLCLAAVLVAQLTSPRRLLGVMAAVVLAAFLSDVLVQAVYLVHDRARPEEVLGGQALLTNGRHWSHIASFPSGHLTVTTAIAVAAMSTVPALRAPMWIYVAVIAVTRITFGAHFPLDVAVGVAFGYEVGRFSAAFVQATGLLRGSLADASPLPRPRLPGLRPRPAGGSGVDPLD